MAKKAKKVTFATDPCGTWEGLYIDGKIVIQDHTLEWPEVLDKLGVKHEVVEVDSDWIAEQGMLPDDLKDVKLHEEE
jgi:hypothetical protein